MKKLILATVSAAALFGIAACSDSGTDATTTQSTTPPASTETQMAPPATDPAAPADPAADPTVKPAEPAPATPPAQQ